MKKVFEANFSVNDNVKTEPLDDDSMWFGMEANNYIDMYDTERLSHFAHTLQLVKLNATPLPSASAQGCRHSSTSLADSVKFKPEPVW